MALAHKDIHAALRSTDGKVYLAARKLGVAPSTLYRRIEASDELKELVETARNELVDIAESSLKKAVIDGEAWAVCFTLKTLGRPRGYAERYEVSGTDGGALEVVVTYAEDHTNAASSLPAAT